MYLLDLWFHSYRLRRTNYVNIWTVGSKPPRSFVQSFPSRAPQNWSTELKTFNPLLILIWSRSMCQVATQMYLSPPLAIVSEKYWRISVYTLPSLRNFFPYLTRVSNVMFAKKVTFMNFRMVYLWVRLSLLFLPTYLYAHLRIKYFLQAIQ